MFKKFFTSESVTEGHPDKVCDQIADAILDNIIKEDSKARVACEVTASKGLIHIFGEISTKTYINVQKIAKKVICSIGYNSVNSYFDGNTCGIITSISSQSDDIAMGVNCSLEEKQGNKDDLNRIGAGDQGMVFGFACDETSNLMPLPIFFANKLAFNLSKLRKEKVLPYLLPDGKTQVTVEYENDVPVRIDTILISAQHLEGVAKENIKKDLINHLIIPTISSKFLDQDTKIFVNPTGKFVIGGPAGDSGLTGRKIIVDTYGGYSRHGGGAFSGKDPTKVDRSGAYMARYIAKNIVAAKIAKKCEVQISYAIGIASPVSIFVETFGTSKYSKKDIQTAINEVFDLRPLAIIKKLDLWKPIYKNLASYGHMGREELGVNWEKTDKKNELLLNFKRKMLIYD